MRRLRRLRNRIAGRIVAERVSPLARQVRRERLTYLLWERLRVLELCAAEMDRKNVPGDFMECGIALGGSAVVLAAAARPTRAFHGYDVFAQIPAPTERDPPEVHERYATITSGQSKGIGGDAYYGYRTDLYEHNCDTLARYGTPVGDGVHLHKGLFDDTLRPEGPVALAHIDSDWFDPVDTCLRRIGPHLSPGGFMVLDDYYDYGGAREAADAFVAQSDGEFALLRMPFDTNAAVWRRGGR